MIIKILDLKIMRLAIVVLLLFYCRRCLGLNTELVRRSWTYSDKARNCFDVGGGLDAKTSSADVILTGTVLEIFPQRRGAMGRVRSPSEPGRPESNGTLSAHVKVWRIMKGTVDGIAVSRKRRWSPERNMRTTSDTRRPNKKRKRKTKLSDEIDRDALTQIGNQGNPILIIHGLWNNHFCGSFVKEGDTRVFFLKKMTDHRERRTGRKRRNSKRKRNKSKRPKAGMSVSSERSDALGAVWRRLIRSGKSPAPVTTGSQKRRRPKRATSILLINNDPARITLETLGHVGASVSQQAADLRLAS